MTRLLAFTKMQGAGNDFVVLDFTKEGFSLKSEELRRIADRHLGVGCDQILVVERSERADFRYRIFNADGGEVEQCGNGARCIAHYLQLHGRAGSDGTVAMDGVGGAVSARVLADGRVSVDLGIPDFAPSALPFAAAATEATYTLHVAEENVEFGAVALGNPHAVLRVTAVESAAVERIGRALQTHPSFPRQVNVGFMQIVDASHIRLRVYERGVGDTMACGTGACAAVAVGRNLGLLAADVEVHVRGGRLSVHWEGPGKHIWLAGPTAVAYTGQADI